METVGLGGADEVVQRQSADIVGVEMDHAAAIAHFQVRVVVLGFGHVGQRIDERDCGEEIAEAEAPADRMAVLAQGPLRQLGEQAVHLGGGQAVRFAAARHAMLVGQGRHQQTPEWVHSRAGMIQSRQQETLGTMIELGDSAREYFSKLIAQQGVPDLGIRLLAIKPGTPLDPYLEILRDVDTLLVMSVEPGFGGQSFIPEVLGKVRTVRSLVDSGELSILVEIDGGINADTIEQAAEAGVDCFVAGSAVYGAADPGRAVAALREQAAAHWPTATVGAE